MQDLSLTILHRALFLRQRRTLDQASYEAPDLEQEEV